MPGPVAKGPAIPPQVIVAVLVVIVAVIAFIGYRTLVPPPPPSEGMSKQQQVDIIVKGMKERAQHPEEGRRRGMVGTPQGR